MPKRRRNINIEIPTGEIRSEGYPPTVWAFVMLGAIGLLGFTVWRNWEWVQFAVCPIDRADVLVTDGSAFEKDGLALLRDPLSLLEKARRERERFARASNALEQLDHFYNFCVTAHAIKDYVDPSKPPNDALRRRWNAACSRLALVQDIANLSKHLELKEPPRHARGVRPAFEVSLGSPSMREVTIRSSPMAVVGTPGGDELDAATIMDAVLAFWTRELARPPEP